MFENVMLATADTMRRVGLFLASAVALTVGASFLTVAAWMLIAAASDSLTAAFVIGAAYLALGLILLAFAAAKGGVTARRHPVLEDRPAAESSGFATLASAFLDGFGAGLTRRK